VADVTTAGWRRQVRRPVVIGAIVVIGVLVIGGATAWAVGGSGSSGYRTATVVRASIAQRLDVVGTVEPVSDASPAFQVGGQVTSVNVAVGATVTAGETLATLDPTALTQSVSSAQSTVESDQAKLAEDEAGQTSTAAATTSDVTSTASATAASTSATAGSQSPGATTAVTTRSLVVNSTTGTITQDQAALVADQKTESTDQQTEAADMTQSDSVCDLTTTPPTPPADPSSCAAALAKVSGDEQTIANDQQKVNADESALAQALTAEQSSLPTSGSGTSPSSGSSGQSSASSTGGTGGTGGTGSTGSSGTSARSGGSTSTATDSAEQIATDQAAIDNAQADLIEAQQALSAAQLTSPIAGTVASVGLTVGDTVAAHSTTSDIVIIGTHSFEVAGTLTSSQVSSVKVGFSADVTVDGTAGSFDGTVSQVGPVQASTSGYSYPVVVLLPSSATGLFAGSTANISIMTQHATNVLAVPTSAVQTQGTRSFVLQMSSGTPVRKAVKVGIVGGIYTQVLSGLNRGTTVVLADLSTPVPASSTTVTGGFGGGGFGGGLGGGGFAGVGGGGGGGGFTRSGSSTAGIKG
jgi:multidrug efflux pump subunit AcrA (membrane-fusion protein)